MTWERMVNVVYGRRTVLLTCSATVVCIVPLSGSNENNKCYCQSAVLETHIFVFMQKDGMFDTTLMYSMYGKYDAGVRSWLA